MVDTLTFRDATQEDVPGIEALLREAGLPAVEIESQLDGFVVLERDGALAACGAIELYGDAALVRSVVVAPALQRSGVGRELVERLEAKAQVAEALSLCLFTVDAWQFWLRLGYSDGVLDDWPMAARRSWQYRYVSTHEEQFREMGLRSMFKTLA